MCWQYFFKPWIWICLQKILLPNSRNDRFLSKPGAFLGKIFQYLQVLHTPNSTHHCQTKSSFPTAFSYIDTCIKHKGACLQWYFIVWSIDICLWFRDNRGIPSSSKHYLVKMYFRDHFSCSQRSHSATSPIFNSRFMHMRYQCILFCPSLLPAIFWYVTFSCRPSPNEGVWQALFGESEKWIRTLFSCNNLSPTA